MSENTAPKAQLWSKIGAKVNTPPTKAPQPPKPAVSAPAPAKKNTLIMKPAVASPSAFGKNTGFAPVAGQKSWADMDDDDDEYVPQPPVDPDRKGVEEPKKLAPASTPKDLLISDLEKKIREHEERNDVLQGVNISYEQRLRQYVGDLDEKDRHTAQLEAELEESRQYVGGLGEKDHYIAQLESELEEQAARIRELELLAEHRAAEPTLSEPLSPSTAVEDPAPSLASEQTALDTGAITQAAAEAAPVAKGSEDEAIEKGTEDKTVDAKAAAKHDPKHGTANDTTTVAEESEVLQLSVEDYPVLSPTLRKNEAGSTSASPPAPRAPVFATPQTIKQAPPVPPAPKLKMGIDMSNWGKKKEMVKPLHSTRLTAYTPKRNANSTLVPKIDTTRDIRKMTRFEREPFGNGGAIEIKIGDKILGSVPKYMLMQCSYTANKHLTDNPIATSITFPENSMDISAAQGHMDWMNQHCYVAKVFSIELNVENDDVKNLNIVRAARVLDLNNVYVGHFTKKYCDKIRRDDLSWKLMELIAALVFPKNDPIFECLANNIAQQRHLGNIADSDGIDNFMQKYPVLAERVDQIECKKVKSFRPHGRRIRGETANSH
jgi:hypothetical protein